MANLVDRHEYAMDLTQEGFRARKHGNEAIARQLFLEALGIEKEILSQSPEEPSQSIIKESIDSLTYLDQLSGSMTNRIAIRKMEYEIEEVREWEKWRLLIPWIPMKSNWQMKPQPPFTGAVVRFLIQNDTGKDCSIYLDCYDNLGSVGQPYWEIYPVDGDTARVLMNDVHGLVKAIESAFEENS